MDTQAIQFIKERLAQCEVTIQQAHRALLANEGAHEVLTELLVKLEQSESEEVAVDI